FIRQEGRPLSAIRAYLDRRVDPATDHVLGSLSAQISLVEYGSYACPYCRAANERIIEVREKLSDRLCYVFRHKPLANNDLALRAAARIARGARDKFWEAHVLLMTRSGQLTEDDLRAAAELLAIPFEDTNSDAAQMAAAHVQRDIDSAKESGVFVTPTFFINNRRYDGPWDESSFLDALLNRLGHRFRIAALDFAGWAPSAGILLLLT